MESTAEYKQIRIKEGILGLADSDYEREYSSDGLLPKYRFNSVSKTKGISVTDLQPFISRKSSILNVSFQSCEDRNECLNIQIKEADQKIRPSICLPIIKNHTVKLKESKTKKLSLLPPTPAYLGAIRTS